MTRWDHLPDFAAPSKRSIAGGRAQFAGASWEAHVFRGLESGEWWWRHIPVPTKIGNRIVGMTKGHKGAPDTMIVHPVRGHAMLVELKSGTAKLTPEQRHMLTIWVAGGGVGCVWHERDAGAVDAFLSGRSEECPGIFLPSP